MPPYTHHWSESGSVTALQCMPCRSVLRRKYVSLPANLYLGEPSALISVVKSDRRYGFNLYPTPWTFSINSSSPGETLSLSVFSVVYTVERVTALSDCQTRSSSASALKHLFGLRMRNCKR